MRENIISKYVIVNVLFIFLIILTTAVLIIFYWPQNNIKRDVNIYIKKGSTISRISKKLAEKGIISNESMFSLAIKLRGLESKIPAGTFLLKGSKTNTKIIDYLINADPEIKIITILEGWTINQTLLHLSKQMGYDINQLDSLVINSNFINKLNINADNLEGYLYPDTYHFFPNEDEKSVIARLVREFHSFWNDSNLIQLEKLNLTKHQILTLASIIEGEAIYDLERSIISAVYHNRMKIGMKLQADPTVQYIIKDGPRRLLNKDLRIDSPYNTYIYKGLPPGPINSPGKKSLHAALFPEKNDYLYFVAKGDGYHTFTTNEADHEKAKRAFQRVRKRVRKK